MDMYTQIIMLLIAVQVGCIVANLMETWDIRKIMRELIFIMSKMQETVIMARELERIRSRRNMEVRRGNGTDREDGTADKDFDGFPF